MERPLHRVLVGTQFNQDNIYTSTILKLFEQFLIPSNFPLILFKKLKNEVLPTFLQIGSSELSDFWSLDQLVVETLGVAYVRPYVRHAFSRKPLITFF